MSEKDGKCPDGEETVSDKDGRTRCQPVAGNDLPPPAPPVVVVPPAPAPPAILGVPVPLPPMPAPPGIGGIAIDHPAPQPAPQAAPGCDLSHVEQILQQTNAELERMTQAIHDGLHDELSAIELLSEALMSQIQGGIERKLDDCDRCLGKLDKRIDDRLAQLLGESYGHALGLGLNPPSDEEVTHGLHTGDCLPVDFLPALVGALLGGVAGLQPHPGQPAPPAAPGPEAFPVMPGPGNPVSPPSYPGAGVLGGGLLQGAVPPPPPAPGLGQEVTPSGSDGSTPIGTNPYVGPPQPKPIADIIPPVGKGPPQPQPAPAPSEPPACPPPPEPEPRGPDGKGVANVWKPPPLVPWWGDLRVCESLDQLTPGPNAFANLAQFMGFFYDQKKNVRYYPFEYQQAMQGVPSWMERAVWWTVKSGMDVLEWIWKHVVASERCDLSGAAIPFLLRAGIGAFQKWTGVDLGDVKQQYTYAINYACPTFIPSVGDANAALLSNTISPELWQCWVKANNFHVAPMEKIVEAGRARPTNLDWVSLWMRGKLSETGLNDRLRDNGVLNTRDLEAFKLLGEAFPGIDDVVRFMVRDVADDQAVRRFDLDAEFDQKFAGLLRDYARASGIDTNLAKYYWRAHWQWPSNTQVYEMLHRLRPERVPKELVFDEFDASRVLAINDVAPAFRDRLLAISYNPLTRVDVQRAYMLGSISDVDVFEAYQDLGYNVKNAQILLKFTQDLKRQRDARKANVGTPSKVLKAYTRYLIGREEAARRLKRLGWQDDQIALGIEGAEEERHDAAIAEALAEVKKAYKRGLLDRAEAAQALVEIGLDVGDADHLLKLWDVTRRVTHKSIPAATLCRMRAQNLLTPEEHVKHLVMLGYSTADAARMAGLCETDLEAKKRKELERIQAANEKEQRREKRRQKQGPPELLPQPRAVPEEGP